MQWAVTRDKIDDRSQKTRPKKRKRLFSDNAVNPFSLSLTKTKEIEYERPSLVQHATVGRSNSAREVIETGRSIDARCADVAAARYNRTIFFRTTPTFVVSVSSATRSSGIQSTAGVERVVAEPRSHTSSASDEIDVTFHAEEKQ